MRGARHSADSALGFLDLVRSLTAGFDGHKEVGSWDIMEQKMKPQY